MADDGEYELLPHEELEYLRNEIHKIKRNPIQGYKEADDLKESIDKLNTSINNLITLFSNTNDELVDAFKKTTIEEHFDKLSSQNEQIAQGILAVAKLVENQNNNSSNASNNFGNDVANNTNVGGAVSSQPALNNQQNKSPTFSSDNLLDSTRSNNLPDPNNSSNLNNSLNSSIPPSMEPPMPAGQTQALSEQAPSFLDDDFSSKKDPFDVSSMPSSPDLHPLNSQNLGMSNLNTSPTGLDLPPPPKKKKGLLGMFK